MQQLGGAFDDAADYARHDIVSLARERGPTRGKAVGGRPAYLARVDVLPGVAGVIAKPFDPMMLPAQVAEILGWDRA